MSHASQEAIGLWHGRTDPLRTIAARTLMRQVAAELIHPRPGAWTTIHRIANVAEEPTL